MDDLIDQPDDIVGGGVVDREVVADDATANTATGPTHDATVLGTTWGESVIERSSEQEALDDSGVHEDGHDRHDYDGEPEGDMATPSPPRRLHAIEVVLYPLSDPDSYVRIPPSQTVLRVLEIEGGDGTLYEVEFKDGRLEQVSLKSNKHAVVLVTVCCLLAVEYISEVWLNTSSYQVAALKR